MSGAYLVVLWSGLAVAVAGLIGVAVAGYQRLGRIDRRLSAVERNVLRSTMSSKSGGPKPAFDR